MKFLMLIGFSVYYGFLFRMQLKMNAAGRISRFPWRKDIVRSESPRWFKVAAFGSVLIFCGLGTLLAFAWYSFANGTLK